MNDELNLLWGVSERTSTDVLNIETVPSEEKVHWRNRLGEFTNRPEKLNALNSEVMSSIKAMVVWAESTDSVRVVVVTGAQPSPPPEGKAKPYAFVAGADITEFVGKNSEDIRVKFTDNAVERLWPKQTYHCDD